jgi:hypothetical protein
MPLSPDPYVGLILYLGRGQKLLALLSLMAILGDFLPIFLANVPFSHSITYATFETCVWISVAVLTLMLTVLLGLAALLLFRPPDHSAELKTLGDVLHLACGSEEFQGQLAGLSSAEAPTIHARIKGLNTKYSIGSVSDQSLGRGIVVNGCRAHI